MIGPPLSLRIESEGSLKQSISAAARAGAKGVVLEAIGELSPRSLSDTGKRELKSMFRSMEIKLAALALPTRRPFDTLDDLEDRLARADRAFALAYELGTNVVLIRFGAIGPETEGPGLEAKTHAAVELDRRAERQGIRLAIETEAEPAKILEGFLDRVSSPTLSVSIDPATLLACGADPVAAVELLNARVVHAYASDASATSRNVPNPRGFGFPGGALDWEAYLGALEEVGYRGFLTIRPLPGQNPIAAFEANKRRLTFA